MNPIKHPSALFLCVLLAASCLLALGGTAGCAGTASRPSTGEHIDDSVITTRVKTALLQDNVTPGTDIKVETYRGSVQLSGFVDTEAQRSRAGEIAAATPGVRSVANNITLKVKQ